MTYKLLSRWSESRKETKQVAVTQQGAMKADRARNLTNQKNEKCGEM